MTIHRCHIPGCSVPTRRKRLYCRSHWFMVPAPIRRRVWVAYAALPHGPSGNYLRVSKEFVNAVRDAKAAVQDAAEKPGPRCIDRGSHIACRK